MLADNESWVLNSTYNASGLDVKGLGDAQNPPKDLDLQNEIFQIATDGPERCVELRTTIPEPWIPVMGTTIPLEPTSAGMEDLSSGRATGTL
jgi:hypothetical protein